MSCLNIFGSRHDYSSDWNCYVGGTGTFGRSAVEKQKNWKKNKSAVEKQKNWKNKCFTQRDPCTEDLETITSWCNAYTGDGVLELPCPGRSFTQAFRDHPVDRYMWLQTRFILFYHRVPDLQRSWYRCMWFCDPIPITYPLWMTCLNWPHVSVNFNPTSMWTLKFHLKRISIDVHWIT